MGLILWLDEVPHKKGPGTEVFQSLHWTSHFDIDWFFFSRRIYVSFSLMSRGQLSLPTDSRSQTNEIRSPFLFVMIDDLLKVVVWGSGGLPVYRIRRVRVRVNYKLKLQHARLRVGYAFDLPVFGGRHVPVMVEILWKVEKSENRRRRQADSEYSEWWRNWGCACK